MRDLAGNAYRTISAPHGIDRRIGRIKRVFKWAVAEELVPASQASDGVLIVLAYLTVLHLPNPPSLLLIEEPENGNHPKRLQEIVRILRQLLERHGSTQVLMTSHSPYLLDEFQPEEVTLCGKDSQGAVQTCRLFEIEHVRSQLDVFSLGEIWTAEGDERLVEASAVKEPSRCES